MIININFAGGNVIYYYDIEKNKTTGEYNACVYRSFATKEQDLFPFLKDIIITKKEVDAGFFITKLNKVFKCELTNTKSFGQIAKQIVTLINSYRNTVPYLKQPLILSIPYLNGKPLPKIEKICLIDNNMYFVTKYKKEYIMHAFDSENMKCMVPVSNIISLCRRLKRAASIKKTIRKKPGTKSNRFHDIDSHRFRMEEMIMPPSDPPGRIIVTSSHSTASRQPETDNMYETVPLTNTLPTAGLNYDDEEIVEIPTQLIERLHDVEPAGLSESETTEQPEQGETAEPSEQLRREPRTEEYDPASSNNNFHYNIERPIRYPQPSVNNIPAFEGRVETIYNSFNRNATPAERASTAHAERGTRLLIEEEALAHTEREVPSLERNDALNDERNSLLDTEIDALSVDRSAVSPAERITNRGITINDSDSD